MKVCILGCAHMHVVSYIKSLLKLNVEIIGVYDKDLKKSEKMSKEFAIDLYTNVEKLLKVQCDIALICSENIYHKEYTVMAAEKKLHVIVEKPVATTMEDADIMIKSCEKNNVELMICFPVRYSSPIVEAKKIIESNRLGKIQSIVATNHGQMPGGWFVEKKLSGGGSVIDHTVHVADIVNWILQPKIKNLTAVISRQLHDIETDDSGLILMKLEDDAIFSIDTSWNRPSGYPMWGDLVIDFIGEKDSLRVDAFLESGIIYGGANEKARSYAFGNDMDFEMLKDFIHTIESGGKSKVTGEHGKFALDIALKAYEFAEF
ncbi:MAG: Gfo/Idh/MocA family protein [Lachnospirales bacterium]